MTGHLCTRLQKLPSEVGAESWPDLADLLTYWNPPKKLPTRDEVDGMARNLEGLSG